MFKEPGCREVSDKFLYFFFLWGSVNNDGSRESRLRTGNAAQLSVKLARATVEIYAGFEFGE